MSDEELIKHKDSDEFLKPKIIEKLMEAWELYTTGKIEASFRLLSFVFTTFHMREFPLKNKLYESTQILSEYFEAGKGGNKNFVTQVIEIARLNQTLKKHVYDYALDITTSMDFLGLMFKTRVVYNDLHKDLSEQNFGDNLSLASKYKKELGKLKSGVLLDYMGANMIYQVYSLWRYDNAVSE